LITDGCPPVTLRQIERSTQSSKAPPRNPWISKTSKDINTFGVEVRWKTYGKHFSEGCPRSAREHELERLRDRRRTKEPHACEGIRNCQESQFHQRALPYILPLWYTRTLHLNVCQHAPTPLVLSWPRRPRGVTWECRAESS